MSTKVTNKLESDFGGISLTGYPHALSAWFVMLLRVLLGGMILSAGLGKYGWVPGGESFDAWGYLANRPDTSPVAGLYGTMAESAMLVDIINVIIPATQVLIGLALIFGVFVRLAALGGSLQMMAFYLGGFEGGLLNVIDSTLIYAVLFLALGAFAAGRILGLDSYIEQLDVGGQALVERYPKMKYLLG